MKNKCFTAICMLAVALVFPAKAYANGTSDPGSITADVLIGRPACLVATIVGSAIFVVSLPIAATSGSIDSAAEALVVKPARATFVRPLGDFNMGDDSASTPAKAKRYARSHKRERHAAAP